MSVGRPLGPINIRDTYQRHRMFGCMDASLRNIAQLWDHTLLKNYQLFQTDRNLRPVWLDKSWQVLWNWNDHNQNHGIELHQDYCKTYSPRDPITSLSFGRGGVLTSGRWRCFDHGRRLPTGVFSRRICAANLGAVEAKWYKVVCMLA